MSHTQQLLFLTVEACEALAVMVRELYASLQTASTQQKADKSLFSIADGLVQQLLQHAFFARANCAALVGEEDGTLVQLDAEPMTVGELVVPAGARRQRVRQGGSRLNRAVSQSTCRLCGRLAQNWRRWARGWRR